MRPQAGAALDEYLACATCFPIEPVTPELIAQFESTLQVMRRAESEAPRLMILLERMLIAVKHQYHLVHMPHTEEWHGSVDLEAAFQVDNWGVAHDEGKTPEDFLFLIGHLASKCCRAASDYEKVRYDINSPGQLLYVAELAKKAKHHTISVGAVCLNWHRRLSGRELTFQPGIDSPTICGLRCSNCEPACRCLKDPGHVYDCDFNCGEVLQLPPA